MGGVRGGWGATPLLLGAGESAPQQLPRRGWKFRGGTQAPCRDLLLRARLSLTARTHERRRMRGMQSLSRKRRV